MFFSLPNLAKEKNTKHTAFPNITSGCPRAFAIHQYGFSFYLTRTDLETEVPPTSLQIHGWGSHKRVWWPKVIYEAGECRERGLRGGCLQPQPTGSDPMSISLSILSLAVVSNGYLVKKHKNRTNMYAVFLVYSLNICYVHLKYLLNPGSNLRLKNTWMELSEHLPSHFELGNFCQPHHAANSSSVHRQWCRNHCYNIAASKS